jgi:pimeloyl-ACP methyl ester carboxylesterase
MSYAEMSTDIVEFLQQKLNIKSAVLVGHSMGGRSVMYTALTHPEVVDRIVIVDISPVNRKFDVTDSTEWNMSHFFHLLKSVRFQDNLPISKVRKDADAQLAKRLQVNLEKIYFYVSSICFTSKICFIHLMTFVFMFRKNTLGSRYMKRGLSVDIRATKVAKYIFEIVNWLFLSF